MESREDLVLSREDNLQELENKEYIRKSNLKKIDVSELPDKLPNLRDNSQTKDSIVANWLINWIESGLKEGKLQIGRLLPSKQEISQKTGVSIGTVQTAIRVIEDQGYVASKQRIGTFICEREASGIVRKQVSKREQTIQTLKKYIVNAGYQIGDELPSSRSLSKQIGSAPNTTRLAVEYLAKSGVIQSKATKGNKSNWVLNILPELSEETETDLSSDSLVNQVERDLKSLINRNYQVGDKLMSHYELSDTLKVSIKTVHDAMKRLVDQGIIQAKRGRYGTFITRLPSEKQVITDKAGEIFAPAAQASLYNYERVEAYLREHIVNKYKSGDRLPAMIQFAEELNVSSNTIRKALQGLSEEGIVRFSRGRYGGTFLDKVPEINPEAQAPSLSWLAVNMEQSPAYQRKN